MVSDAEARARYEEGKASRFGSPERRRIEQIVFPSEAEARGRVGADPGGTSFDDDRQGAQHRAQGPAARHRGAADVFDAAVRDAAFALPEGGVSGPVAGRFGIVLVRVGSIDPEHIRPFDEVAGEVKPRSRWKRPAAPSTTSTTRSRTSAPPPSRWPRSRRHWAFPCAPSRPSTAPARDKAGKPVDGTARARCLAGAAFASDIGVDNETLRSRDNGYVWFEITSIEPARDRPLDEVRAEVERQWRRRRGRPSALADKARSS